MINRELVKSPVCGAQHCVAPPRSIIRYSDSEEASGDVGGRGTALIRQCEEVWIGRPDRERGSPGILARRLGGREQTPRLDGPIASLVAPAANISYT